MAIDWQNACDYCDYVGGGSHYHCPNCGELCSMMGHLAVGGNGYRCEFKDNPVWRDAQERAKEREAEEAARNAVLAFTREEIHFLYRLVNDKQREAENHGHGREEPFSVFRIGLRGKLAKMLREAR